MLQALWVADGAESVAWLPLTTGGDAPARRFHHTADAFDGGSLGVNTPQNSSAERLSRRLGDFQHLAADLAAGKPPFSAAAATERRAPLHLVQPLGV